MTSRRLLLLGALTFTFASTAGLVRAEDDPIQNEEAKPAPKAKKKPAKKKGYDYDRSKYKSRSPEEGASTYRFNENGDPVDPQAKKKAPAKKKKRSEPPEIGSGQVSESCGPEETSCSEKKTEADAL
ncbi:MAG: hypothetical protein HYV14_07875 [Elusimicrobia bacterium]|nr:hypothetical protein [Elusimicrobiota bacterium]